MAVEIAKSPKNPPSQSGKLIDRLRNVLSTEERFCSEGQWLPEAVCNAALAPEPRLLDLLLSDQVVKNAFFTKVGDALVFDKSRFYTFVNQKSFLPDSYTSFKNKIGLADGRTMLSDLRETVLVWPYKDGVLKGGQTKEERGRDERFYHKVLAAEQIDQLFAPKALVAWQKWDSKGVHKPESVSQQDNFIIKGNNLIALHSLAPVYRNKVKLIYIDPPYNTGSDAFQYNDRFGHSTWLTFMKNRLEIARELLRNDGAIFIQVDDAEFAYLKVLCDEVFGRDNFREAIVLKSGTESGVNAINVKRGERLFKVKEYILFYSKTPSFRFRPFYTRSRFNRNYRYKLETKGGKYVLTDLLKVFKEKYANTFMSKNEQNQSAMVALERHALAHPEQIYSLEKNIKKAGAKFKAFAKANKAKGSVEKFANAMGGHTLVYDGGTLVPLRERVFHDEKGAAYGVLASDLWTDIGTTPSGEGGVRFANGKKPEKLLHRILEMATDEGDLVLDYHLGSGTTAAVAHKMNRRYVGIEQMDYGDSDPTLRLQNVILGDPTGVSKKLGWSGGGSFVSCSLAKLNANYVTRANRCRSKKCMVALFREIMGAEANDYRIEPGALHKGTAQFEKLSLTEQRAAIFDILDSNDLYVSHAEMGDRDYDLPPDDCRLTEQFYA